MLISRTLTTARHTSHYWEAGPSDGPLMVFLHGWPESALMWRAQMEAFAAEGWHCVAPDMRGYGKSSVPADPSAYAVEELVRDMVERHDQRGGLPAVWVGHDLGSPVVGALAAHHSTRCRGVALFSVPYFPDGFALSTLVPLVDRGLYPADEYPEGQWDYCRFYETHFEQTVSDFDAELPATLALIFRYGDPASVGTVYRSATITRNGGWFGAARRAPPTAPDHRLWPVDDFAALVADFSIHGFRPANAWYLNNAKNVDFARTAPDGGRLTQPVLFINGNYDAICDIGLGALGAPMENACSDLTISKEPSGHWLPLERKEQTVETMRAWLRAKALS